MPQMWFWAHAQMVTRLQAEQALRGLNAAMATNNRALNDGDRQSYVRDLELDAHGGRKLKAPKATLGVLKRMGVQVAPPPEERERR